MFSPFSDRTCEDMLDLYDHLHRNISLVEYSDIDTISLQVAQDGVRHDTVLNDSDVSRI